MSRASAFLFIFSVISNVGIVDNVAAAEFFRDTFDDGDHTDGMPVLWRPGGAPDGTRDVVDGRLVHHLHEGKNMSTYVEECFGEQPCVFGDVSLRTDFLVTGGQPTDVTLFARSLGSPDNSTLFGGIDGSGNALLAMVIGPKLTFLTRQETGLDTTAGEISLQFDVQGGEMSLWTWNAESQRPETPTVTAPIPETYPHDQGTVGFHYRPGNSNDVSFDFFDAGPIQTVTGDFDQSGVIDGGDIDQLNRQIRRGHASLGFDLTADGIVNPDDRQDWVGRIAGTWFGDADLDGEFNSGDLVLVFQAGEYEDQIELNSTWAIGDWNGDGEFDSSDLVTAFQYGGFEQGPRPVVRAVAEPHVSFLTTVGFCIAALCGRLRCHGRASL